MTGRRQCSDCGSVVGIDVMPEEYDASEGRCVLCILGVPPGAEGE